MSDHEILSDDSTEQPSDDPIAAPEPTSTPSADGTPAEAASATEPDAAFQSASPASPEEPVEAAAPTIDLDAMTADLDGVEAALARLADGTYWTDEVTGEPIPAEVLASDPMARRA